MTRSELIFEIHKASPMYSTGKLNEMNDDTLRNLYNWMIKPQKAKVLKDDSMYSQSGERVKLVTAEESSEVLEPYDPAYLDGYVESNDGNPYRISNREKRFLHKVSILEHKLRRAGVSYEWMERYECFRVWRFVNGSEYRTFRFVRVNMGENDYSFGTEKEDLVFDAKVSVVVEAVKKWVNSNLKRK